MVQCTSGVKHDMKTASFAAIVADYRDRKLKEELATDWGSVVFYRMPAFVIAWALAPLGATPNQLTVTGLLLVPLIALAAWFLEPGTAVVAVTLMALAFNVLDCADGPLARATGKSSLAGRYLDFAADIIYRIVAYASFGLIADHAWPGAAFPWVAVGLCCGVLVTYARVNRIYAAGLFPATSGEGKPPAGRSAFDIAFSFLSGLDTLLPLIAFLAWEAGVLREAMVWFLLFTLGDAVVEVVENVRKAARVDHSGRT